MAEDISTIFGRQLYAVMWEWWP